jgi:hypothetical protein
MVLCVSCTYSNSYFVVAHGGAYISGTDVKIRDVPDPGPSIRQPFLRMVTRTNTDCSQAVSGILHNTISACSLTHV